MTDHLTTKQIDELYVDSGANMLIQQYSKINPKIMLELIRGYRLHLIDQEYHPAAGVMNDDEGSR